MNVRERGGVPLRMQLFRQEVSQPECGAPDCYLDIGQGGRGGHHHKAGSLYLGTCNLCAQSGLKAEYTGESGFSAYTRNLAHLRAVRQNKPSSSALASHTKDYHPEAVGMEETFSVRVLRTYKKPLDRQIAEAVLIHRSGADILLNRKDEWLPPVTYRLQATQQPGRGQSGGGGGGRGAGLSTRARGRRGRGRSSQVNSTLILLEVFLYV